MRHFIRLTLAVGVMALFVSGATGCGQAMAQAEAATGEGQPAAKATAVVGGIWLVGPTSWTTVMANEIKTANHKDLFVNVSLESALLTKTQVKSKGGKPDTSSASATIRVRVLCDGVAAMPGYMDADGDDEPDGIVFNHREQELTATFQGLLDSCLEIDPDTGEIVIVEECLQPEELELLLRTMSANSFSFIIPDLGSGIHTVAVQAMIDTKAKAQEGSAEAEAYIGHGSVTVQEVRMIRNEDLDPPEV